jgi:hypothetical protein
MGWSICGGLLRPPASRAFFASAGGAIRDSVVLLRWLKSARNSSCRPLQDAFEGTGRAVRVLVLRFQRESG